MDHAFKDLIEKIIAIYQDDLIVFSKETSDHVKHLQKIFDRCRKYGISLIQRSLFLVLTMEICWDISCKMMV